jgi:hypothetical protein
MRFGSPLYSGEIGATGDFGEMAAETRSLALLGMTIV